MQKIFFGNNQQSRLKSLIKSIKPNMIFLVTGDKSYLLSGSKKLIDEVSMGYKTYRFSNFSNDPKLEDVKNGVELIKKIKPDLIISIGGGSAIDMGKQINILSKNTKDIKNIIIQKKHLKKSNIPLIAIPTTSGTGSESTSFSVMYIDKKKYSVESKHMIPDYAFIIPKLGNKMSKRLRASTAFDAFSQAIESYWSINSTKQSKTISSRAIKLIKENLTKSMKGNEQSRSHMYKAANLSGQAINITKTTAAHAISYVISSKFNLQHGHSVALTLGKFFKFNMPDSNKKISDPRGAKYLNRTMKTLYKILGFKDFKQCERYWYSSLNKLNLVTSFKKIGLTKQSDINYLVDKVDNNRLQNNPIYVSPESLKNLLNDLKKDR